MSQARRLVTLLQSHALQFDGRALAGCIAWHRRRLEALARQQRDELRADIAAAFPHEVFSAVQIWQVPELRAQCIEANITTIQQLGLWLRTWCGAGLARVCRDQAGIVWNVSAADLHEDAGIVVDDV